MKNNGVEEARAVLSIEGTDDATNSSGESKGGTVKTPMRALTYPLPFADLHVNPVTSIFAIVVLWGMAIWCMVSPDEAKVTLGEWQSAVTNHFTWFYVITNPFLMFFCLWLAYRHGDIKLGPKDAKPEYDNFSYFAMMFSAGIGVGLFVFGVAEPLFHRSSHWFVNQGYRTQDEIDMFAINLTVFHWGFTGWSQYLIVAICSGLASYRFKLPMTFRSCFYPLLGEYTWGWIGDMIDGITIVTTVAGVCTSLGLGTVQVVHGLERLDAVLFVSDKEERDVKIAIIWIITAVASISVLTGLKVGIKYLSYVGFFLGSFLLLVTALMDNTRFVLNLIVQEIGYYIQWSFIQLNFHTDAFAQLNFGEGRATDGKSAHPSWMDWWTIFYIGWWVAWAAFVGIFIARISQGRTIRNVVMCTYIIPLAYTIVWFCVFGGVGMRQSRQAAELKQLGATLFNNPEYYVNGDYDYCYDVPQSDVVVNNTVIFTNTLPGVTPVCAWKDNGYAWYQVMYSFSYPDAVETGFGPFLSWVSLIALIIYFVTSSDSGSLIVDQLAANGVTEPFPLQRVFWAFTEGWLACALMMTGGDDALEALQAASIVAGLPFSCFLVLMCFSITRMCNLCETIDKKGTEITLKEEHGMERTFNLPVFGGVFNIFEYLCSGFIFVTEERRAIMPFPSLSQVISFGVAFVFPPYVLMNVYTLLNTRSPSRIINILLTICYTVTFFTGMALFFTSLAGNVGLRSFGWASFIIAGCILAVLRSNVRQQLSIRGNFFADCFMSIFMWPQVLVQMEHEYLHVSDMNKDTEI